MSQQPPPPPYDGPPAPANPYGPGSSMPAPEASPPGSYPPVSQGPPPGMTNRAKFWVGFVLALPANFVAAMLTGAGSVAGEAIAPDTGVGGVISGILGLALLAGLVVGIVMEKTRRFALGILAGTIIMGIVAVVVIVLFLIALTESLS